MANVNEMLDKKDKKEAKLTGVDLKTGQLQFTQKINLTKETVYKEFFDTIDESREWGIEMDEESSKYAYYIDGVTDLTKRFIDLCEEG